MNKHNHPASLNLMFEKSIKENWELMAFSDLGGAGFRYRDVAESVAKLHLLFQAAGISEGDKVALCGRNSARWAIVFIACLTYKAVAVPILHEFKPDNVHHLVNHSDARLLFADESVWENLDENQMRELRGVIFFSGFELRLSRSGELTKARERINEIFGKRFPQDFTPADVCYPEDHASDLAMISYTSGSTGNSKGVMLPFRSLRSNVAYCLDNLPFVSAGDGLAAMLPLAHLYGLSVEMLFPFCKGMDIHFLTRLPSPKVILDAFATVRPKLIVTVPLVIEKIIRGRVFPMLEKPLMRVLLKLPVIDTRLLAKVRQSLLEAFGGNVREVIIGGAPLNPEVERFLRRIEFPFTVGYGMTECGPLIAYAPHDVQRLRSCGRVVDRMQVRVDSPDPASKPGNLWVRGDNLMCGYYKNPKATAEAMPPEADGWMNTGDLCTIDPDGFITISGRSKTMILGPSGQNIYPEEIEQKLDNMPYVAESLVIDDGGRLLALVYPDLESMRTQGLDREALEKIMNESLASLNAELPAYSRLSGFKIMEEEFEKTPKRSIKRYLYQP